MAAHVSILATGRTVALETGWRNADIRGQRPSERLQEEAIPFESMQRCSRNRIDPRVPTLDDQVVGCGEAVVVGETAAAVAADVPVGTAAATAAAVAVAAAADVPVGTAAAVAKGQANAAAVFDYFRVPTAVAAAFYHSLRNRRNHYVGRRPLPRGLAESHRQRARGDRAGPPGGEGLTASPSLLCGWHTNCE